MLELSNEYFSTSDLATFQSNNGAVQQAAVAINGNSELSCTNANTCGEGNLDVQFLMGLAQRTTTIYWYEGNSVGDPFVQYLLDIESHGYVSKSNSISWGADEYVSRLLPECKRIIKC